MLRPLLLPIADKVAEAAVLCRIILGTGDVVPRREYQPFARTASCKQPMIP